VSAAHCRALEVSSTGGILLCVCAFEGLMCAKLKHACRSSHLHHCLQACVCSMSRAVASMLWRPVSLYATQSSPAAFTGVCSCWLQRTQAHVYAHLW
jgi:hypothetical protein